MSVIAEQGRERNERGEAELYALHRTLDEQYVAHYWWSLGAGSVLPLLQGRTCRVLFAGYQGGAAGPDVRDAVLSFDSINADDAGHVVGDVEFHVRASDWVVHRHQSDMRYNAVLLHVVLLCDTSLPTVRQDGVYVPICSLYDLAFSCKAGADMHSEQCIYPCQRIMMQRDNGERMSLLTQAGVLRFEQKTDIFVESLHALAEHDYHLCLIPALAEALAYGRDRAFFHAVAMRLLDLPHRLPEPLGRASMPMPLDAVRLAVIKALVAQRYHILPALRAVYEANRHDSQMLLQALRSWLYSYGVRPARADILLCNIILPFIAAIALIEHDEALSACAIRAYKHHPGLPSNRVTRRMTKQLALTEEPHGACAQQGLHYIYQQTCREKQCDACLAGREPL